MAADMCVVPFPPLLFLLMRYLGTAKYVRGMYAVRVKGRIPEDVEAELESRGIKYRSRDQTDQD
jgi:transcription elongation factor SPT4